MNREQTSVNIEKELERLNLYEWGGFSIPAAGGLYMLEAAAICIAENIDGAAKMLSSELHIPAEEIKFWDVKITPLTHYVRLIRIYAFE